MKTFTLNFFIREKNKKNVITEAILFWRNALAKSPECHLIIEWLFYALKQFKADVVQMTQITER